MHKDIMNNKELTELKIEQPDNMEAIEHAFDEVIKDLILLREHVTGFEDARKYDPKHTAGTVPFETTPSNDEIKREALKEFVEQVKVALKETEIKGKDATEDFAMDMVLTQMMPDMLDAWLDYYLTQKENNE